MLCDPKHAKAFSNYNGSPIMTYLESNRMADDGTWATDGEMLWPWQLFYKQQFLYTPSSKTTRNGYHINRSSTSAVCKSSKANPFTYQICVHTLNVLLDATDIMASIAWGLQPDKCLSRARFLTSGSRPHLGSPSDFRGVARLSTNLLKNDGIFKY